MSARSSWFVVAHHADGERVTSHRTKAMAKSLGRDLRAAGVDAFVYDRATAVLVGIVIPQGAQ